MGHTPTADELNKKNLRKDNEDMTHPWSTNVYCQEEEKSFELFVPFGSTYDEFFNEKHRPVCITCGNNDIIRIILNEKNYLKRDQSKAKEGEEDRTGGVHLEEKIPNTSPET